MGYKVLTINDSDLADIRSLREHLITTSKFPELFKDVAGQSIPNDIKELLQNPKFFYHGSSLLFIWLGFLNCVIEGWFQLRLRDKLIENLIGTSGSQSENTIKLKDFRDCVFHFQKNKKPLYSDFIYDPGLLKWAMDVNFEFEKWFDYYFTANTLPRSEPQYEWFQNLDKHR